MGRPVGVRVPPLAQKISARDFLEITFFLVQSMGYSMKERSLLQKDFGSYAITHTLTFISEALAYAPISNPRRGEPG